MSEEIRWDEPAPRPGDAGYEAHVKGRYLYFFGLEGFRKKFGEEPTEAVREVASGTAARGGW